MPLHNFLATTDAVYRQNRREIETFTATLRMAPRLTVTRIPLVVHVLHHAASDNISDAQVKSQVDVLNLDFRKANTDITKVPAPFAGVAEDALVEFALAVRDPEGNPTSGITRTNTSIASFEGTIPELDRAIKSVGSGAKAWPADRYLNVWVCALGGLSP
jgi:hypothetical protein